LAVLLFVLAEVAALGLHEVHDGLHDDVSCGACLLLADLPHVAPAAVLPAAARLPQLAAPSDGSRPAAEIPRFHYSSRAPPLR
jgi:hypothetical protein